MNNQAPTMHDLAVGPAHIPLGIPQTKHMQSSPPSQSNFQQGIGVSITAPAQVDYAAVLFNDPRFKTFATGSGLRSFSITFQDELSPRRDAIRSTLTTTGLTSIQKLPEVVELGREQLHIADIMGPGQTSAPVVRYVQETSAPTADGSLSVSEGGEKPEATFDLDEVDATVVKIAVIGRLTEEMVQDYPAVSSYVQNSLRYQVAQKEDTQLLTGSGTPPELQGILGVDGVQDQPIGSDTAFDAIFKAMTKVRAVAHQEPTAVVISPEDYQDLLLTRAVPDGQYLGGGPFLGSFGQGPFIQANTIWSVPVIVTTGMSGTNKILVGDFRFSSTLFRRQGVTLSVTNTDGNDFKFNRIAFRVESRAAAAWTRPPAFCTVSLSGS